MKRTLQMIAFAILLTVTTGARGDGFVFGYEGDIVPEDPASQLIIGNPCELDCSQRIEDGHFVLEWGTMGDFVNYGRFLPEAPEPTLPTFWAEWRFRSNQPKPSTSFRCDARFRVDYGGITDIAHMFQDSVFDDEGGDFVLGLDPNIFHTYRFESLDGNNYTMAVDGVIFNVDVAPDGNFGIISFGGDGGCGGYRPLPVRNEWDFIRFGTLGTGEQVLATDRPAGSLTAAQGEQLRSFTITFDQPAYLYVDDITVAVTGGVAPTVVATRRQNNGATNVVEVFIDGRVPAGETTTFTFDTGAGPQTVQYTRIQPDIPASSAWGLIALTLGTLIAGAVIFRRRAVQSS